MSISTVELSLLTSDYSLSDDGKSKLSLRSASSSSEITLSSDFPGSDYETDCVRYLPPRNRGKSSSLSVHFASSSETNSRKARKKRKSGKRNPGKRKSGKRKKEKRKKRKS